MRNAAAAVVRPALLHELALLALVAAMGVVAAVSAPYVYGSPVMPEVAATAASAVLVLVRRYWPGPVFLASALVYGLAPVSAVVGVAVTAVTAGRRIRSTVRLALLTGVAIALATAVSVLFDLTPELLDLAILLNVGIGVVLLGLPALAGALVGERRPLAGLLSERNDYLERAALLTAANARAAERTRIAGEMHDVLGHRLSLISVHAGALEYGTETSAPQLSAQAELVRTTAHTALEELRQILLVLGVSGTANAEDAELTGTRVDVTALVEHSRAAGMDVRLTWSGDDLSAVDVRTRRAVNRAVREALTNTQRHAPTSAAEVRVDAEEERIRIAVVNGLARSQPTRRAVAGTGRGLAGLGERAALLGGTLHAAQEGSGFALRLELLRRPAQMPEAPTPGDLGTEPPLPRRSDVLSLRRAMGVGCLALLVVIPIAVTVLFLIVLITIG